MVLYGARDTLLAQYVHLQVLYGLHNGHMLWETLKVKDLLHSQDNTKQAPNTYIPNQSVSPLAGKHIRPGANATQHKRIWV